MPGNINIEELISKYLFQELTTEESDLLNRWLNEDTANRRLFEKLTNEKDITAALKKMEEYDEEKGWLKIETAIKPVKKNKSIRMIWWSAAASLVLTTGVIYYKLFNIKEESVALVKNVKPVEAIKAPDKSIASITLADGSVVPLDSLDAEGGVMQGSVKLEKHPDGHLSYNGSSIKEEINKVVNPRGSRVIHINLSDGTGVWLNAGSSISYPIAFTGATRNVDVNGEVYFEVTEDNAHPFVVKKDDVEVTVLGTCFNINAFDGEKFNLTLLTGKVNVKNSHTAIKLLPGQQGIVGEDITVDKNVNTEAVMAWKNGLFYFNQSSLKELVKQIERWYNVDITVSAGVPERIFGGKIKRDASLINVLKIMEESNIHYTVENNKIMIIP